MAKSTAKLSKHNIITVRDCLKRDMSRVQVAMQKRATQLNDPESAKLAGFAGQWLKQLEQLNLFITDEAIAIHEAKLEEQKRKQAEKSGKEYQSDDEDVSNDF